MALNKPIRKVALIGAGAVGCYFILNMMNVPELDFKVIATGARKERLENNGLMIQGELHKPRIMTPEEAGVQDVIFVATKYMGLDDTIEMLPGMVGEDTLVLSLLNGVDSEERIAAVIGWEHMVPSLMRIASVRSDSGVNYRLGRSMGLFYGIQEDQTSELSATAVERLEEMFALTRLYHHPVDNIKYEIWLKYAMNITNNLPQAIFGVPACLYDRGEHGVFIAGKLWEEVKAVAKTRGVELGEGPGIFAGDNRGARYSTLQDIEAGRHTEIDMFCGVLMKMAAEAGIPVPYAEYTYHAIKVLEEKNDGLFVIE